jgi:GNAT superfamily N-acetyltransferase
MSITARLHHCVVQLGWCNAALYALDRLLALLSGGNWALYRYHFVAQALVAAPLCPGRGTDIEVRLLASPEQIPPGYPRPADVLRRRYQQGAQSLAAYRHGELVGFLWFRAGAYQEDEVRARYLLPAACAWDFDVYVRPAERLGWVFRRLWEEAQHLLRARGVGCSCSRISAFNAGSLRAHARLGARRLGSATFLRCGRWQWMLASLAPYIHLSRSDNSFPQLRLNAGAMAASPLQEPPCQSNKSV